MLKFMLAKARRQCGGGYETARIRQDSQNAALQYTDLKNALTRPNAGENIFKKMQKQTIQTKYLGTIAFKKSIPAERNI